MSGIAKPSRTRCHRSERAALSSRLTLASGCSGSYGGSTAGAGPVLAVVGVVVVGVHRRRRPRRRRRARWRAARAGRRPARAEAPAAGAEAASAGAVAATRGDGRAAGGGRLREVDAGAGGQRQREDASGSAGEQGQAPLRGVEVQNVFFHSRKAARTSVGIGGRGAVRPRGRDHVGFAHAQERVDGAFGGDRRGQRPRAFGAQRLAAGFVLGQGRVAGLDRAREAQVRERVFVRAADARTRPATRRACRESGASAPEFPRTAGRSRRKTACRRRTATARGPACGDDVGDVAGGVARHVEHLARAAPSSSNAMPSRHLPHRHRHAPRARGRGRRPRTQRLQLCRPPT